jgi:hypothetical protein
MKKCACGAMVPDWMRFHRPTSDSDDGHYVDDPSSVVVVDNPVRELPSDDWPVRFKRSGHLWGPAPHRCRPPTIPVPSKPWGREDELRRSVLAFLELQGCWTYDLEQGHRADESSRQTPGIGDAYFFDGHHGLQGWIETKRWDNEPSEDQRTFGERVLQSGGIYLLVYELGQVQDWWKAVSS